MKNTLFRILTAGILLGTLTRGVSAEVLDHFIDSLKENPTIRAGFTQKTYSYLGELQGEMQGILWFRPDKEFRVEYTLPLKEVIITNEKGYVDYIPEDDELIEGTLDDFIFVSPFAILKEARNYFTVEKSGEKAYILTSRGEETGDIEKISLTFGSSMKLQKISVNFYSGNIVYYSFSTFEEVPYQNVFFDLKSYTTFLAGAR
ncbi:MAG TPA: outer membrane lipoprotein carrier protein LolA [Desulfobacteraceae bacterium]|nr:outer membrane lipoprotein carrier protein LolA [Desulfobacteraceae bacterium]